MNTKEKIGIAFLILALIFFIAAGFESYSGDSKNSQHTTTRAYILLSTGVILTN